MNKLLLKMSHTRMIAFSFLAVILVGTLLLTLPISSKSCEFTPVLDCMFTATSATCVTGLVIYDTYTHWSMFGQMVILIMIQIGGLGLMTLISMFTIFRKKRIGLHERMLLMQTSGNIGMNGVVRLTRQICIGTVIIEGIGAVLLFPAFYQKVGLWKGIYFSIFHSISAFCNAGFDLMGFFEPGSSLTQFQNSKWLNCIIMLLIIIGGIGFYVWSDIRQHQFHFKDYSLHSKIVLSTTTCLIFGGAILFALFESGLTPVSSLFMSVTTRTAGFNTIDISKLSENSLVIAIILMFIGGSPGSTAGGVKTTTIAIIFFAVISLVKADDDVAVFRKKLDNNSVRHAAVICFAYIIGITICSLAICKIDGFSFMSCIFESVSASATVGLTTGITSSLSAISKVLILLLMYGGRIGAISILLIFSSDKKKPPLKRPTEKILLG